MFIFPVLLDWIRNIEEDCTENTAGLKEQIALWTVPFGLVGLGIPCWLCYASCKYGIRKSIVDSLPSLAASHIFLFCTVLMYTLEVAVRSYSFYHNSLAYAVSAPLGQVAIPLVLLAVFYCPSSCKCKSQSQIQEELEATNPPSISNWKPSETTFESPHSDTATEETPLV